MLVHIWSLYQLPHWLKYVLAITKNCEVINKSTINDDDSNEFGEKHIIQFEKGFPRTFLETMNET